MMFYQGKRVVFLHKLVVWTIVFGAIFMLTRVPRQQIHQVSVAIGQWLTQNEILLIEKISANYPKIKPQVVVVKGDHSVESSSIAQVLRILHTQSLPQVEKSLALSFQQPISVYLFGSRNGYLSGLEHWGIRQTVAATMVNRTNGVANGSVVYIPLYANTLKGSLYNVLTHELTHVIFNQNQIARSIPTWINEGVAWMEGLQTQADVAKRSEMMLVKRGEAQVLAAFGNHEGVSLTSGENAMLQAPYDVELEDYMAVTKLVHTFGWKNMVHFMKDSVHEGPDTSFQKVFAESIRHYMNEFQKSLHQSKI